MNIIKSVRIEIGALGNHLFQSGIYYYGGSARRGLLARIERHRRKTKNIYWHIDYLTSHQGVSLEEAWLFPDFPEVEHDLTVNSAVELHGLPKGFGNGDCKHGCPSHLWKQSTRLLPDQFSDNYHTEIFTQNSASQ